MMLDLSWCNLEGLRGESNCTNKARVQSSNLQLDLAKKQKSRQNVLTKVARPSTYMFDALFQCFCHFCNWPSICAYTYALLYTQYCKPSQPKQRLELVSFLSSHAHSRSCNSLSLYFIFFLKYHLHRCNFFIYYIFV